MSVAERVDPTGRVLGDVHTHVFAREHLSEEFQADLSRVWGWEELPAADYEAHAQHALGAHRSVVLAFDAAYAGFVVPDEYVAEYVARDPQHLVGFCSIDPGRQDWRARLGRAVEYLGLRGVKLAPTYQGFDPLSTNAFALYEEIARRGLPIVWHQGTTFVRRAILAYALPRQIDDVAIRFPELKIVIAHLGHPWIDECVAVVRKHPNVYADISALTSRPHQFLHGLVTAGEYGCGKKLLFGTDFPFDSIARTRDGLSAWRDDPAQPEVVRACAKSILTTDPLETLGL
jgi:predicted TIM-barrel fold metal-dependent hydrolase